MKTSVMTNLWLMELEKHNLHKRFTNLQEGSIDVALVKEFYANLYSLEDQSPKQARVRGHLIKIDADSLNDFLETLVVLDEGESLPTYSRFCRLRTNHQEIKARLCIPRKGFVLNTKGQPWKLLRKDLTTLFETWSVLSYSNLAPTSHTSDLNMDRARLIYGLVTHMDMNIGALISGQISSTTQSNSSRLEFPALITALCKAKGVTSDSLTYESLSQAINLAYIKKNCWNLGDLTVNIKGTRKARTRPADVPSSSTPSAPSTFATLKPAPQGPSTHSSQHFESMLQSLFLGQTMQDVVLQRPIMSVEQFLEKVQDASSEATIPEPFVEEADPPTPVNEMPADPPTPILEIPEDPATPVLGLTTTPPVTPVLHFTDEKDTQDQDIQQQDQSQEF
ncbi:hypothetical protein GmHk_10G028812 [Glycine max]|nr:hypothetical protein GmHk_10G028812 [Glycine max]